VARRQSRNGSRRRFLPPPLQPQARAEAREVPGRSGPQVEVSPNERDMDNLFLEEFAVSPQFAKRVLEMLGLDARRLYRAEKSFRGGGDGMETDLLLEFERSRSPSSLVLLIENKICQPLGVRQVPGYKARAKRRKEDGQDAHTVLLAPRSYMGGGDAGFDHRLDYEDMSELLGSTARARYKQALIAKAIGKAAAGSAVVSTFFGAYARRFRRKCDHDILPDDTAHRAGAGWIACPRKKTGLPGRLRHKFVAAPVVDLLLPAWGRRIPELRRRLEREKVRLPKGMAILPAGRSASLQWNVPALVTSLPMRIQRAKADKGIAKLVELYEWAERQNWPLLLG
jgi:hypothetical protein